MLDLPNCPKCNHEWTLESETESSEQFNQLHQIEINLTLRHLLKNGLNYWIINFYSTDRHKGIKVI